MTNADFSSLMDALAIATANNVVLRSENAKLKKRVRELEHIRVLDQSSIVQLRRQIQLLAEGE